MVAARKREKSVRMACATNAPRKHKSTTIRTRNGSQDYPPKTYGLLQNSKISRQARSLAPTPSEPPPCLALNSAKLLRSAAFQDLKCFFGQASFQESKCFRLRFASPVPRTPKKSATQAYFRLSVFRTAEELQTPSKVFWLVHFTVRFGGSGTATLATGSRSQPHKISQGAPFLFKVRSLKTLHHEAASSEVNRNIKITLSAQAGWRQAFHS